MDTKRIFEYSLVALVVMLLVGVFGHYVEKTHQQLAGAKLTTAYHAMRMSMTLIYTHCQANTVGRCATGNGWASTKTGEQVRTEKGYPAASADGIVAAAGLKRELYTFAYTPGGLVVQMVERSIESGCAITYKLPKDDSTEATLDLDIHFC